MPGNTTQLLQDTSENVERATAFSDDSSDISDEYPRHATNANSSSNEIDSSEIKYIYRFVCKKCGDHRHQTDDCQVGDVEHVVGMQHDVNIEQADAKGPVTSDDVPNAESDISKLVEEFCQQQGYKAEVGWWREAMVLQGEKRLSLSWRCRFCHGDLANPIGQCLMSKGTISKHRKLVKLIHSWSYRNVAIQRQVAKVLNWFFKCLRRDHPRRLDWHRGSPTIPKVVMEAFNKKFKQADTLAMLQDVIFAELSAKMEVTRSKYAKSQLVEPVKKRREGNRRNKKKEKSRRATKEMNIYQEL